MINKNDGDACAVYHTIRRGKACGKHDMIVKASHSTSHSDVL